MARGWFGGDAFKGLLKVDLNFPIGIRLKIDGGKFVRNVGNRVAGKIRKRLEAGNAGGGEALPIAESNQGGEPLKRTGQLIKSVKYRGGWISPSTTRRGDIGSRARSNFGLMSILISGVFHKAGVRQVTYGPINPLGSGTELVAKDIQEASERELRRQLAKGETGLLLELKRNWKQAQRKAA